MVNAKKERQPTKNPHSKTQIAHKKGRRDIGIRGTAAQDGDGFAAERRLWIYLGRCSSAVTEEKVAEYLNQKSPGFQFEVTKLVSQGKKQII